MDIGNAFKSAIVHQSIAYLSLLAGAVLVVMGVLAGFQGAVTTLIADPLDPAPAIERANPMITIAFCVLAVVVWQFGKTYALFVTLPRATGRAAARRFDPKRVSSEVTADLDERLAAIEADVAETRRTVDALAGDDRTATYDEDELPESTSETDTPAIESAAAETDGPGDRSGADDAARRRETGAAGSDPLADDTGSDESFDRD